MGALGVRVSWMGTWTHRSPSRRAFNFQSRNNQGLKPIFYYRAFDSVTGTQTVYFRRLLPFPAGVRRTERPDRENKKERPPFQNKTDENRAEVNAAPKANNYRVVEHPSQSGVRRGKSDYNSHPANILFVG